MKKKILSLLLIGIAIISLTGCGGSFKSEIINKSFSREVTGYNDVYVSTETFIFKEDGKGIVKNEYSNSSRNNETNITYEMDEKNNTITIHYENGKNTTFSYLKDKDCITITNSSSDNNNYQYCNK